MKRVFASTAVALALVAGGSTVAASAASAQTVSAPIASTGSSSGTASFLQTLLAGRVGCLLGSVFGTTLPNC
ncbi:hypothetical protein [Nocardia macrotermitis]|uniref:Secreted protein n=1 Tax=Nocardia macrotermitis TaxID=2585198 RepID=A0A7K0DEH5_9NOCA|nr:hypothetical protein [Nocardia macrotermitis]MQY23264.1 hypothetical protein [Nocardia macrotermitis]